MFLAPSKIHYMTAGDSALSSDALDRNLIAVSRHIVANGDTPKIQVVAKDGNWFTLNNAQLALCRRLELEGRCTSVPVDIVPFTDVPKDVLSMMVVPTSQSTPVTPSSVERRLPEALSDLELPSQNNTGESHFHQFR